MALRVQSTWLNGGNGSPSTCTSAMLIASLPMSLADTINSFGDLAFGESFGAIEEGDLLSLEVDHKVIQILTLHCSQRT